MAIKKLLTALLATSALTGCAALPSDGPDYHQLTSLRTADEATSLNIEMVDISPDNIDVLGSSFVRIIDPDMREQHGNANGMAQTGDALSIKVWEASPDGIFSTERGANAPILARVSSDGEIYIPYAGNIAVQGLTVDEIRQAISAALLGISIDPQVQVEISETTENAFTIVSGVPKSGLYPLMPGGTNLLEAIASAGGSKAPKHETLVSVIRENSTHKIMLSDVFNRPENNFSVAAGDILELSHQPKSFTAFGAVTKKGRSTFVGEELTLEQAMAISGGLDSRSADSAGVFVFRYEYAQKMSPFIKSDELDLPVIYRLDMSNAQGFFLARQFEMQNNDILYVATAPAAELSKFINTLVVPAMNAGESFTSINN